MNNPLSIPAIQSFIQENLNKDTTEILLKYKQIEGVSIHDIVRQIQGKQKAKNKLPTWYATEGILFPPAINLEQSSSEATAKYKAELLQCKRLIDLTGGFGVDVVAFSRKSEQIVYVERNKELLEVVGHNLKVLGVKNVTLVHDHAENYLKKIEKGDCVYIDPARRDQSNNKMYKLEDCEPNVPQFVDVLLENSDTILIKGSPLLDLKAGMSELKHVAEIHVVSVDNECKEVLFVVRRKVNEFPLVVTLNILSKEVQEFKFDFKEESDASSTLNSSLKYLYEPNASILKAGAFNSIANRFNLYKLHKNSHLYTSDHLVSNFPGRKFEILSAAKYDQKEVSKQLAGGKANITVRNFYDTSDQVRKKLKLKEGGEYYLFATTDLNNKPLILITKKAAQY